MRRIRRLPLPKRAQELLQKRADEVARAADPAAAVEKLWSGGYLSVLGFDDVRETLRRMASGVERCMYCEDSHGNSIEHFWPKADFPDRAFDWTNYLWACSECNSNQKRDQFPRDATTGKPLLIDPTDPNDDPAHHLDYSPVDGRFMPRDILGETSCDVFGLNREALKVSRKAAQTTIYDALVRYAEYMHRGLYDKARERKHAVLKAQFSAVFAALVRLATHPDGALLVGATLVNTIAVHPEILEWLTATDANGA